MLGTMMAEFVRLRYPHSILLLINPHMGITFIHQMTPERQRYSDVEFTNGSKEDSSTAGQG